MPSFQSRDSVSEVVSVLAAVAGAYRDGWN